MALAVDEVRAALTDADETIRRAAVSRLDVTAPGAVEVALLAMADPHASVRRAAVDRLVDDLVDRATALAVLVPLLAAADNVVLRNAAVDAVVGIGSLAVPLVEAALALRPPHTKVLCDTLGLIGASRSAPAIVSLLSEPDDEVVSAAAEALGLLDADPVWFDAVRDALQKALEQAFEAPHAGATRVGALLEAMARRSVPLTPGLVRRALLTPNARLGTLRALGRGAAPKAEVERAALRALVVPELSSTQRARRETAIIALGQLLPVRGEADLELSAAARAETIEALLEGTVEVQRAAATVLGATGAPEVMRPLLVAASDPALARTVEVALARVAEHQIGGLLAVAAEMPDGPRTSAYRALSHLLPSLEAAAVPVVLAALEVDVRSKDIELAAAAMDALAQLDSPAAAHALAATLESAWTGGDPERIAGAREALGVLGRRHPKRACEVASDRSSHPAFLELLAQVGRADVAETLLEHVRAPDTALRRAAADGLAELALRKELELSARLPSMARAAHETLADASYAVRAAGVRALAAIELRAPSGSRTVQGLLRAATDEDVRVRAAAARALVLLASRLVGDEGAALQIVLRTLADGRDGLTSIPALEALLSAQSVADDARLIDALTGKDDERRKVALNALRTRPRLLLRGDLLKVASRALHDVRWDLRRAAIGALAAVGDTGRPALRARRAAENDPVVRADLDAALDCEPRRG